MHLLEMPVEQQIDLATRAARAGLERYAAEPDGPVVSLIVPGA
jgi:hypothetical protein